jgi:hypothetical protein
MTRPVGEKRSPAARIFPFKVHTAVQPFDTENKILAMPNFLEDYWVNFDWSKAITEGMKRVGLPYSGKYGFVETRMYSSIHHEVVPASKALGCSDCHSSEANTCMRCHKNAQGMALPSHRLAVYPDDPARVGGRFYITLGRGMPPK